MPFDTSLCERQLGVCQETSSSTLSLVNSTIAQLTKTQLSHCGDLIDKFSRHTVYTDDMHGDALASMHDLFSTMTNDSVAAPFADHLTAQLSNCQSTRTWGGLTLLLLTAALTLSNVRYFIIYIF